MHKKTNNQYKFATWKNPFFLWGLCIIALMIGGTLLLPVAQKDAIIKVENGDGAIKICQYIKKNTHLSQKNGICLYLRVYSALKNKKFIQGEYTVKKGSGIFHVGKSLLEIPMHPIVFPEGLTVYEVLEILNRDQETTGEVLQQEIKEGTLMPDTYIFANGASKSAVISKMQAEMKAFVEKEWDLRDDGLPIQSPMEAIIIASIVEHEATSEEEKDIVASVYLNRIRKRMRLQADPTLVYFLTEKKGRSFFNHYDEKGNVIKKRQLITQDLWIKNEYNSYRVNGLPPTPICNPSRSSILAVLHPRTTDYIFFVADGKGGHIFTSDFETHVVNRFAVKRRIRQANMNKGKNENKI